MIKGYRLHGVDLHAKGFAGQHNKPLREVYSGRMERSLAAKIAATTASSDRNTDSPSETRMNPRSERRVSSSSVRSPSGPMAI
jgi:hypothetical protein